MIKLSSECLLVPPEGFLGWRINISFWFMMIVRPKQRRTNLTTGGGNCPKISTNISSTDTWNSDFWEGHWESTFLSLLLQGALWGEHIFPTLSGSFSRGPFFTGTPWPPSAPTSLFPRGRGGSYLMDGPLNRDSGSPVVGYEGSPSGLVSEDEPVPGGWWWCRSWAVPSRRAFHLCQRWYFQLRLPGSCVCLWTVSELCWGTRALFMSPSKAHRYAQKWLLAGEGALFIPSAPEKQGVWPRRGECSWLIGRHFSRPGFDPWVGKIPWRRERLLTPVFWLGEFHGLYSPWGCKELDTTERLSFYFSNSSSP